MYKSTTKPANSIYLPVLVFSAGQPQEETRARLTEIYAKVEFVSGKEPSAFSMDRGPDGKSACVYNIRLVLAGRQ